MSPPSRPRPNVDVGRLVLGLLAAVGALAVWTVYAVWNARRLAATPRFNSHEWSLLTGVVTGLLSLLLVIPAFLGGAPHLPTPGPCSGASAWPWPWAPR
jgi:drug/metabolite transporter (DMT)-like permease